MQITSISNTNSRLKNNYSCSPNLNNINKIYKLPNEKNNTIKFKGLVLNYNDASEIFKNLNLSCWFRRGKNPFDANISEGFKDIFNTLTMHYKENNKISILNVGVANSQEPLSILASVASINKNKQLVDVVDYNCVDLQPKISDNIFKRKHVFYEGDYPKFAKDSFIVQGYGNCVIKPEIENYLLDVYNNPQKSKWNTPIENYSAQCKAEKYDLILCNNVLEYVQDPYTTLYNLIKMLKSKGSLIIDDYELYDRAIELSNVSKCRKIYNGIWQKQS